MGEATPSGTISHNVYMVRKDDGEDWFLQEWVRHLGRRQSAISSQSSAGTRQRLTAFGTGVNRIGVIT
jgi:hypothetical protein